LLKNKIDFRIFEKSLYMTIERTKEEVIIRVSGSMDADNLQRIIDFIRYRELVAQSQATQEGIDALAIEVNTNWWKQNRSRFINP